MLKIGIEYENDVLRNPFLWPPFLFVDNKQMKTDLKFGAILRFYLLQIKNFKSINKDFFYYKLYAISKIHLITHMHCVYYSYSGILITNVIFCYRALSMHLCVIMCTLHNKIYMLNYFVII